MTWKYLAKKIVRIHPSPNGRVFLSVPNEGDFHSAIAILRAFTTPRATRNFDVHGHFKVSPVIVLRVFPSGVEPKLSFFPIGAIGNQAACTRPVLLFPRIGKNVISFLREVVFRGRSQAFHIGLKVFGEKVFLAKALHQIRKAGVGSRPFCEGCVNRLEKKHKQNPKRDKNRKRFKWVNGKLKFPQVSAFIFPRVKSNDKKVCGSTWIKHFFVFVLFEGCLASSADHRCNRSTRSFQTRQFRKRQ
jgi:hypothetical protein